MNCIYESPVAAELIAEWIRQKRKEDPNFIRYYWALDRRFWIDIFTQVGMTTIEGIHYDNISIIGAGIKVQYSMLKPDFFEWLENELKKILSLSETFRNNNID